MTNAIAIPEPSRREQLERMPARGDVLEAWLRAKSPDTVAAYRQDALHFARWADAGDEPSDALRFLIGLGHIRGQAALQRWLDEMIEGGSPRSTVHRRASAMRSLLRAARAGGMIDWTVDTFVAKRERDLDVGAAYEDLSVAWEKVLVMLAAKSDSDDFATMAFARRDLALLRLGRDAALRRMEVLNISISDIDLRLQAARIRGKGRARQQSVPLPDPTLRALRRWLKVRGAGPGPLFVRLDRRAAGLMRLRRGALREILIARCMEAETAVVIRPHDLRRLGITKALEASNGDLARVQGYSRHVNVGMLATYDLRRRRGSRDLAEKVAAP